MIPFSYTSSEQISKLLAAQTGGIKFRNKTPHPCYAFCSTMTKLKNIFADPLLLMTHLFILVLPFVFFTGNDDSPFEVPKFIFSSIAILLLIALYVLRSLPENEMVLRGNRALLLIAIFAAVQTLAYVFSINHFASFWGDYFLPADSWLSIALFTVFAVLICQLCNTTAKVKVLTGVIIASALLTALHGTLQYFSMEVFPQWKHLDFSTGVFGLFGQPVAFAAVLGMSLPLVLVVFLRQKNWPTIIAGGALLFFLNLAILFTSTRAAIAANLIISILLLLLFFRHRKALNATSKLLTAFGLILAANALFYTLSNNSELQKKLHYNELSRGTSSRLLVWKGGVEAWKRHPVLGTGPETFSIVQLEFQNRKMNDSEYWNKYWAKAHNAVVQLLTSSGLLGLAALLALCFYLALIFLKLFRNSDFTENRQLAAAFIAGFLFLQLANLTAFNFIVTQLYSYVFPVLAVLLLQDFKTAEWKFSLKPPLKIFLLGLVFLLLLPLSIRIYSFWNSDFYYHQAIRQNYQRNFLASMENIEKAIESTPSSGMLYCLKADILVFMLKKNRPALRLNAITDTVKVIDELTRTCTELGINRSQYVMSRAMIFGNLFYDKFIDDSRISEEAFAQLKKMTPVSPIPYYRTGLIYSVSHRETQFIEEMNKALELKPDYIPAYKDQFLYYYSKKDSAKIQELIERVSQVQLSCSEMIEDLKGLWIIAKNNSDEASAEKLFAIYDREKKRF